jgi:hypothetical protein
MQSQSLGWAWCSHCSCTRSRHTHTGHAQEASSQLCLMLMRVCSSTCVPSQTLNPKTLNPNTPLPLSSVLATQTHSFCRSQGWWSLQLSAPASMCPRQFVGGPFMTHPSACVFASAKCWLHCFSTAAAASRLRAQEQAAAGQAKSGQPEVMLWAGASGTSRGGTDRTTGQPPQIPQHTPSHLTLVL